jgi:GTP-binding protein HflX
MSARKKTEKDTAPECRLAAEMEASQRTEPGVERIFLAGVELRHSVSESRHHEAEPPPQAIPASARQARRAAQRESVPPAEEAAVDFSAEESLAELRELARGTGAEIVGEILQRRDRPDPATLIGSGKVEELAAAVKMANADLVVFDHELTPSQFRNLEKLLGCRVLDRTQLILDIFAGRARTREGQLQVEKAQLDYLLPRLAGRGIAMSQTGGGIGTRGPGETRLETDRRKIRKRILAVEQQLADVRRVRTLQRARRESLPVPTIALAGYTNAGKSTLFNALTGAGVYADDRLFATLDPTLRALTLPSKRPALLSDTVGFIRNLPHTLVEAFRATLEEVEKASLLIIVADAASPSAAAQMAQVEKVLGELHCAGKPRLRVMNKIDLMPMEQRAGLRDREGMLHISAKTGYNLSGLLAAIDELLPGDPLRRLRLRVPQSEGKVLAQLEAHGQIYERCYDGEMVELALLLPKSYIRQVEAYEVRRKPRAKAQKGIAEDGKGSTGRER